MVAPPKGINADGPDSGTEESRGEGVAELVRGQRKVEGEEEEERNRQRRAAGASGSGAEESRRPWRRRGRRQQRGQAPRREPPGPDRWMSSRCAPETRSAVPVVVEGLCASIGRRRR